MVRTRATLAGLDGRTMPPAGELTYRPSLPCPLSGASATIASAPRGSSGCRDARDPERWQSG